MKHRNPNPVRDPFAKDKKKKKKKSSKRLALKIGIALALVCILVGTFLYIYFEKRVYKECCVECGTAVSAKEFVRFDFDRKSATFKYGSDNFDVHVPGEYPIEIELGSRTYKSKLIVTDTIAPVVDVTPKTVMYGQALLVDDFIMKVVDESECTTLFAKTPAFNQVGEQDVFINCTDKGNNTTQVQTKLRVIGIHPELTKETGDVRPGKSDFAFEEEGAELLTDLSTIDMNEPGDYTISFVVDGVQYDSVMHLKDTRPPQAKGISYEGFACYPLEPEALIEGLTDATNVKVEFVEDPHFEQPGERDIQIKLTDQGGNEQIVTSHIKLEADTEAPVITGVKNITVLTNQSIAYKDGVKVTDNADPNIELSIDNSQVDLTQEGTYNVTYTAVDGAGNEAKEEITVTVVYRPYTEDDLWALCDEILAQILHEGMSEKEKAEAIFNWVDWSIMYKGHAEKVTWVQGAYDGIKNRIGDCFNVACACHALYTRAGFETFMVERYPITYAQHFWNAIKIDGTWYFCDALTKEDGTRFFMWTAKQMKDYSDSHRGYFYYDESKYEIKVP